MTTLQELKAQVRVDYPKANLDHLGDLGESLATLPLEYRDQPLYILQADFVNGDPLMSVIPANKLESASELASLCLSRRAAEGLTTTTIAPPIVWATRNAYENTLVLAYLNSDLCSQEEYQYAQLIKQCNISTTLFATSDIHMKQVLGIKKKSNKKRGKGKGFG